jgi:SHS2 domain-containing protein
MGYFVSGNGELRIKKENLAAAYDALMALQDAPPKAKRGGSSGGDKAPRFWYSWMPEDLRTLTDTKAVFAELGFEVRDDENGDLLISCYDNKTGQEDVFFAAAAPFIEDGDYEWTGEDSDFWAWEFSDGKMYSRGGGRMYGNPQEVNLADLHAEQVAQMERIEAIFAKK